MKIKKEKPLESISIKKIGKNILLVKFNYRHMSEAVFDNYLKSLKMSYLEFEENFIVIFDSGRINYLPANLRQKQAHWIKENETFIKERIILSIYIISNPIIRFILEAIFLIHKSPVPYEIYSHFDEALSRAKSCFDDQQPE